LFRKELNRLQCASANARFWENLRFLCSEAAGDDRQKGVNMAHWTVAPEFTTPMAGFGSPTYS
jgi:hypothetical protein